MASERIDAPPWAGELYAQFPRGVRIEGGAVVDEVAGFSAELEPTTAALLAPLGPGTRLATLLERAPASWPMLAELNRAHMLNFRRAGGLRALSTGRACHRFALDGAGPVRAVRTLARALVHLLRACPAFAALLTCTAALVAFVPGHSSTDAALVVAHSLAAYLVHELGHAAAAGSLGVPAYVLVDRHGLSVWARLGERPDAARLFAAAGPGAAFVLGLMVLAALSPLGVARAALQAAPYLLHVVALVPPSQDGRVFWRISSDAQNEEAGP
jgi:hypothetical protein